jgi:hypothetical protein
MKSRGGREVLCQSKRRDPLKGRLIQALWVSITWRLVSTTIDLRSPHRMRPQPQRSFDLLRQQCFDPVLLKIPISEMHVYIADVALKDLDACSNMGRTLQKNTGSIAFDSAVRIVTVV